MLGGALSHSALFCGTATAFAIVSTHRAPPIAACDPQPTTTESCFLHHERRVGSRQKHTQSDATPDRRPSAEATRPPPMPGRPSCSAHCSARPCSWNTAQTARAGKKSGSNAELCSGDFRAEHAFLGLPPNTRFFCTRAMSVTVWSGVCKTLKSLPFQLPSADSLEPAGGDNPWTEAAHDVPAGWGPTVCTR